MNIKKKYLYSGLILIIDSNNLLNRFFYAMQDVAVIKDLDISAVYGYIKMLYRLIDKYKPRYIINVFDSKEKTIRKDLYMEYKAKRKSTPIELCIQFNLLKKILNKMQITYIEKSGYEADDIIGTLANLFLDYDIEIYILTSDQDLLQIIQDKVSVLLIRKSINNAILINNYTFNIIFKFEKPSQIIDYKSLAGDKVDNIIGVKGIGDKWARKLLKEFNNIINLYNNLNKISNLKIKEKLEKGKKDCFFFYSIIEIDKQVPLEFSLSTFDIRGRIFSQDILYTYILDTLLN